LRQFDKAIADHTTAVRLDPQNAAAFQNRALAYRAMGDEKKAKADLAEAERLTKAQK
jgi:tetratricopeptide (TPR) repeat protein